MPRNTEGKDTGKSLLPIYKERSAPYKAFLFYAILGSGLLFLALSILFIVWVTQQPPVSSIRFPKSFVISTLALLFSSYTLSLSRIFHLRDQAENLMLSMAATFLLALVFISFQIHAIFSVIDQGVVVHMDMSLIFLGIITGFHFLHIALGFIYLFYLNLKTFDIWKDPVKSLIYFSNKFESLRFELFSYYWYFNTGIWLFLFLIFFYSL